MDIKAQIEKIVEKISSDATLKTQFQTEPIKAVEKILGVDLPDDIIQQIITGVKAKITADGAKDVLGSLKKLF